MSNYDDIINLPHHVSKRHPQMPLANRAAQFAPFAALTGYDAAIIEAARNTEQLIDLEEDSKEILDDTLSEIRSHIDGHMGIAVTYFEPDNRKSGGSYQHITGILKDIDDYRHMMVMDDGHLIPMQHILDIKVVNPNE